MWSWLQTLAFRAFRGEASLRAVVVAGGAPYRPASTTLDVERTPEPAALPNVLAALDDAGLRYDRRWRGFGLHGRDDRVMPVRVRDPGRITPAEMRCGTQAPELLLDLALALVPLFGPLLVEVRFAGSLLVDGRRDRRELGEQAAVAVQQFGRRLARHAPMTVPILLERARRMRAP